MANSGGLDRIERQIIILLQQDGRKSFVDLAETIGVAEGTIRRKFSRLLEEGFIKIAAVTDPFRVGLHSPAIIGLKVARSMVEQVAQQLASLEAVRYVALTTGMYDIIIEVICQSNAELSDFILKDLSRVEGILETNSSLLLKIYKQSYDFGVGGGTDA